MLAGASANREDSIPLAELDADDDYVVNLMHQIMSGDTPPSSKMLRGGGGRILDETDVTIDDASGLVPWLIWVIVILCAVLCCLASIAICIFCELVDTILSCLCCRKPT
jgi:hypothetical protein